MKKTYSFGESIAFQKMKGHLRNSFEMFGFVPHHIDILEDVNLMREQTNMKDLFEVIDPCGNFIDVGLRVDHTVSLAKFVVERQDELIFPLKRYTSGPVFRPCGDGGYMEFCSCDIDIVGKNNLPIVHDAEIIAMIKDALCSIGLVDNNDQLMFSIKINNKKVIDSMLSCCGISSEKKIDALHALQSGDLSMFESLLGDSGVSIFDEFRNLSGSNEEIINGLRSLLFHYDQTGIDEIEKVCDCAHKLGIGGNCIIIDPMLIRSMEYYTGTIYCTYLNNYPEIGSICHGGRYNVFKGGDVNFPSAGVTVHLNQLFDCMMNHFSLDTTKSSVSKIMVSGISSIEHAMYISNRLRQDGIKAEMFLDDNMSIDEQVAYAKKRGFRAFVWTDAATDRRLRADDMVKIKDLQVPLKMGHENRSCYSLFTDIKVMYGKGLY